MDWKTISDVAIVIWALIATIGWWKAHLCIKAFLAMKTVADFLEFRKIIKEEGIKV